MLKKFTDDVEAALGRLGLAEDAQKVPVDKTYQWLVRNIVGRMLTLNGASLNNDVKSKLWAYHAQILNSTLANVTKREALGLVASVGENPEVFKRLLVEVFQK